MAGDETAGQPQGGDGQQQGGPQGQPHGQGQTPPPGQQPPPQGQQPYAQQPQAQQGGMAPNVAALLSYLVGWITGLIFFLTQSHPEVRFHAAQSIITFGGLTIISFILGFIPFGVLLTPIIWLLGVGLWILLMIKGNALEHFKLPIVGDYAEQMSGYHQAAAQQ